MQRRFGIAVAACALTAALALPAAAGARTKTVYPGGPVKWQNQIATKYGAFVDNFMINRVTINVGDTVVWDGKARFNGGFHTVDFPAKGGSDVPLILPTGNTVTGVDDAAGNPFWFNGKVPALGFNPALFAASKGGTYDGSKRIDSGLPVSPKPTDFKLKFTKPGVYRYFCDVHPGMIGFVVVKKKGQAIPSTKADAKTLAKEQAAYVAGAKKLDKTKVTGANVSLGQAGANGLEVLAMFPGKLTVKNGTTVTFAMAKGTREVHTATFGPAPYINALANAFATSQVFPGNAIYPSDPPGSITLNPTSHGNGFANVGALDRDPTTPLPPSGQIKFTAPGTYHFICLVHPFMHGTVVVKP
jgi:plastocyanin